MPSSTPWTGDALTPGPRCCRSRAAGSGSSRPDHRRPRALRLDLFQHGWIGDVLADPVELAGAVVVARPRREEVELAREPLQVLALLGLVVAVRHLEAGEPGGGHLGDHGVGDGAP